MLQALQFFCYVVQLVRRRGRDGFFHGAVRLPLHDFLTRLIVQYTGAQGRTAQRKRASSQRRKIGLQRWIA